MDLTDDQKLEIFIALEDNKKLEAIRLLRVYRGYPMDIESEKFAVERIQKEFNIYLSRGE